MGRVATLGRVLWNYLRIGAPLERREAIVAFGGHDLRVADWAAQLWLDGWAPKLVLSGGSGYYTSKIWKEPEAHKFRRIAIERGVNADAILVEDQSSNSGENVALTRIGRRLLFFLAIWAIGPSGCGTEARQRYLLNTRSRKACQGIRSSWKLNLPISVRT
jgi:hypothetical protein